jgi:hypothetical protein
MTMGADMSGESITVSTIELQPGEDVVAWYNRVTKIFQDVEFKSLPTDVKKYMLYGPPKLQPMEEGKPKPYGHFEAFTPDLLKEFRELKPVKQDQTIKADAGKPPLSMVPMEIVRNIAIIRDYGNRKYKDPWSWKRVDKSRYNDAMLRHALAYIEDPLSVDEESGLPHLWHLACNIAFLCDMLKEELNAIYTTTRNEHQPR